jgi:hypothetical protein
MSPTTVNPSQSLALDELARLLYDFLPGKPHPYGNKNLSFPAIAAELGLGAYWPGGSKQPAIRQLLEGALTDRSGQFSRLIVQIVQKGATKRKRENPITRDEMEEINECLLRLEYKISELHAASFLDALPRKTRTAPTRDDQNRVDLSPLIDQMNAIMKLTAQERGYAFERFLSHLFAISNFAPRPSFRLSGEQIDGSFECEGQVYLLEAKWRNAQCQIGDLLQFDAKVGGKAKWSRGLYVSYSGFTPTALETFAKGRRTNIVCMDGLDLHFIVTKNLSMSQVMKLKSRAAAESNRAYASVRELFPSIA